jgi:hypothetical protein
MTHSPSLVDRLHSAGVTSVEREHLFYSEFITYDFESLLVKVDPNYRHNTVKTLYTHRHQPICVGLASSLGVGDPDRYGVQEFIIDENPQQLVKRFILGIMVMRRVIVKKTFETWRPVLTELTELIKSIQDAVSALEMGEDEYEVIDFRPVQDKERLAVDYRNYLKQIIQLKIDAIRYIREVPVLAFNAARYDVQLIRDTLVSVMTRLPEEIRAYTTKLRYQPGE